MGRRRKRKNRSWRRRRRREGWEMRGKKNLLKNRTKYILAFYFKKMDTEQ